MIYKGNPVSAGIAIGSAFVYDPKILTAPEDAPVLPMECELERYENAVQAAQAKLREIQAAFTGIVMRKPETSCFGLKNSKMKMASYQPKKTQCTPWSRKQPLCH